MPARARRYISEYELQCLSSHSSRQLISISTHAGTDNTRSCMLNVRDKFSVLEITREWLCKYHVP